jgi:hypothetical protein
MNLPTPWTKAESEKKYATILKELSVLSETGATEALALLQRARNALEPGAPLGPQHMNTLEGRAAWLDGTRSLRAEIDALLAKNAAPQAPVEPHPPCTGGNEPAVAAPGGTSDKHVLPTPRTDALIKYHHNSSLLNHMISLARQLERELAEAREIIDGLRRFKAGVDQALNSGDGSYRP